MFRSAKGISRGALVGILTVMVTMFGGIFAAQPSFANEVRACSEYSNLTRYSQNTARATAFRETTCTGQITLGVRGRYVRNNLPDSTECESSNVGINIQATCTFSAKAGDTYRSQHRINTGGWVDGPAYTW